VVGTGGGSGNTEARRVRIHRGLNTKPNLSQSIIKVLKSTN
jgi:hypothetical protein